MIDNTFGQTSTQLKVLLFNAVNNIVTIPGLSTVGLALTSDDFIVSILDNLEI